MKQITFMGGVKIPFIGPLCTDDLQVYIEKVYLKKSRTETRRIQLNKSVYYIIRHINKLVVSNRKNNKI
jgi:hypothetical protein